MLSLHHIQPGEVRRLLGCAYIRYMYPVFSERNATNRVTVGSWGSGTRGLVVKMLTVEVKSARFRNELSYPHFAGFIC